MNSRSTLVMKAFTQENISYYTVKTVKKALKQSSVNVMK